MPSTLSDKDRRPRSASSGEGVPTKKGSPTPPMSPSSQTTSAVSTRQPTPSLDRLEKIPRVGLDLYTSFVIKGFLDLERQITIKKKICMISKLCLII